MKNESNPVTMKTKEAEGILRPFLHSLKDDNNEDYSCVLKSDALKAMESYRLSNPIGFKIVKGSELKEGDELWAIADKENNYRWHKQAIEELAKSKQHENFNKATFLIRTEERQVGGEEAFEIYAKENLYPYAPKGDDKVWDEPEYRRSITTAKKAFLAAYPSEGIRQEWISVEKELPKATSPLTSVIGYIDNDSEYPHLYIKEVQYDGKDWTLSSGDRVKVIKWMPLPSPPPTKSSITITLKPEK